MGLCAEDNHPSPCLAACHKIFDIFYILVGMALSCIAFVYLLGVHSMTSMLIAVLIIGLFLLSFSFLGLFGSGYYETERHDRLICLRLFFFSSFLGTVMLIIIGAVCFISPDFIYTFIGRYWAQFLNVIDSLPKYAQAIGETLMLFISNATIIGVFIFLVGVIYSIGFILSGNLMGWKNFVITLNSIGALILVIAGIFVDAYIIGGMNKLLFIPSEFFLIGILFGSIIILFGLIGLIASCCFSENTEEKENSEKRKVKHRRSHRTREYERSRKRREIEMRKEKGRKNDRQGSAEDSGCCFNQPCMDSVYCVSLCISLLICTGVVIVLFLIGGGLWNSWVESSSELCLKQAKEKKEEEFCNNLLIEMKKELCEYGAIRNCNTTNSSSIFSPKSEVFDASISVNPSTYAEADSFLHFLSSHSFQSPPPLNFRFIGFSSQTDLRNGLFLNHSPLSDAPDYIELPSCDCVDITTDILFSSLSNQTTAYLENVLKSTGVADGVICVFIGVLIVFLLVAACCLNGLSESRSVSTASSGSIRERERIDPQDDLAMQVMAMQQYEEINKRKKTSTIMESDGRAVYAEYGQLLL
ncbi:uncharacterized protein MONOS_10489 [Monocercomonoides exilis]|uniref:uncharacterized protein n=1 Tax=Monocercomonoides exilis TaxID=2049356 RepID=UPI00355A20D8|nr:hypothetical protein MONOS_10489 [Monocercomonoides exilis]|eukprot:MONOS_10489.1-p1 / transcript=MONOS_10489.1 / gene=MONOS_10489 / organism=Monocercomonoides_exilis_PA203 / gene_product=unspecified product / transcript_product=unspecified product / location=Mono_scaffold00479:14636-16564(-) / protein_length=585 / sequence_SO=supercontig / SO=protein_coding / is_pseudo=false